MEINKIKNDMGSYDIYLTKDDKTLKIVFAKNLDLYLTLTNGSALPEGENIFLYFDITKENYEIFCLFDSLYREIITGKLFDNNILNNFNYNNYDFTKSYEYSILVDKDFNIIWISDDGPAELEDVIKISKIDNEKYRLIFYRNNKPLDFGFKSPYSINVRIRNSGSRYAPFNCIFMRMYQKFQTIEPEYHQIHFEEFEYIKK